MLYNFKCTYSSSMGIALIYIMEIKVDSCMLGEWFICPWQICNKVTAACGIFSYLLRCLQYLTTRDQCGQRI